MLSGKRKVICTSPDMFSLLLPDREEGNCCFTAGYTAGYSTGTGTGAVVWSIVDETSAGESSVLISS